jgi:hypothetical protein
MLRYSVSANEMELLGDIEDVAFGEIFSVSLETQKPTRVIDVSEKAVTMIKLLRRGAICTRLVIHDSEPSMAEIEAKAPSGRRCLKKIKF